MSPRSDTRHYLLFLAKLALIMLLVRSLILSPFNIPSESMQPRLLIGDFLLVNKWPYGYSRFHLPAWLPLGEGRILARTPERGDVVVFAAPANPRESWIKRVIGLPGDRIEMIDGAVHINGQAIPKERIADLVIPVTANMVDAARAKNAPPPCFLPEFERKDTKGQRQCHYPRFRETLPNGKSYETLDLFNSRADNLAATIVPKDHVFVMGDNRDRSEDSRFAVTEGGVGMLPMDHLIGRASITFFATDGSASWLKPWTWPRATRTERIGEGF